MSEVPACQWASLITRIVHTRVTHTTTFSISVSLDSQAITSDQQWARILIVYRPIPLCEPLVLQRLAMTAADVRRRARNERPFTHPNSDESSIPTIIVEIYYERAGHLIQACLRTLPIVPEIAVCEFEIAYGWTQKFSRESKTCTATFQANWPFYDIPRGSLEQVIASVRIGPFCSGPIGVLFDVHIFSPRTRRINTPKPFSEDIIRKIGRHLVRSSPQNWRQDLLSFGLASKSTSTALNLFFEVQDEESLEWGYLGNNGPSMRSAVSSMRHNPEKANLIQCVSPGFYKYDWPREAPGGVHSSCCDLFIELLSLAKSAKRFTLPEIHPQSYPQLMEALSARCNVEICNLAVEDTDPFWASPRPRLTFLPRDVFKLLSRWPHLHTLSVQIRRDSGMNSETRILYKTACNLEKLNLQCSELEESNLLGFLPAHGLPRLSSLRLTYVTGISMVEFRTFLDSIAPVIQDIGLSNCRFNSDRDDESVVPDETIARMTVLKTVYVLECGNFFGPSFICARENKVAGSSLGLLNTHPFAKQDVIAALRSAKWDVITVNIDSPDDDGEVMRIAKQQGVTVELGYC